MLAIFRDAFPKPILWNASERAQIVREIRRSGHRKAEFNCSGKFRSISVWFLKVAIYPGGIVCEIWGLTDFGITSKEIDGIKREAVFLDTGAIIVHRSPFLGNPISLHFADNKTAMDALMSLAP